MNSFFYFFYRLFSFDQVSLAGRLPFKIRKVLSKAKKYNQTIIFVTGVFDILHFEHQKFLEKAKNLGHILLVGIESDLRVKQLKGKGRPCNDQIQRLINLRKINIADEVFILPENFFINEKIKFLIVQIKPKYLAVSSNTPGIAKKRQIMEECGSDLIIVHQHNPNISTTLLLERKVQSSDAICYNSR